MAITTVGFDGTIDEAQFSRLMLHHANYKHKVTSGFVTTAAAGTRTVSVSAGVAVLPGPLVESSAAETRTFAANATGSNRVDYLVLRGDWVANTATIVVVQGSSSSTPPALTQTEGALWEMPLARVTVRPSVTTLLSSDVVACKPLPRNEIVYTATIAQTTVAYNGGFTTAATITVADPGWPFTLQMVARGRFSGVPTGLGILRLVSGTTEYGRGHSIALFNGAQDVPIVVNSAVITSAPLVVTCQISPSGMSSGSSLLVAGDGQFSIRVVPA